MVGKRFYFGKVEGCESISFSYFMQSVIYREVVLYVVYVGIGGVQIIF